MSSHIEEQTEDQTQSRDQRDSLGIPAAQTGSIEHRIKEKQERLNSQSRLRRAESPNIPVLAERQSVSSPPVPKKIASSSQGKESIDTVPVSEDWTPKLGEQLEGQWGSAWYPAKIINVESGGKYEIHFTRYPDTDTTYDEVVSLDRLRPTDRQLAPNAQQPSSAKSVNVEDWKPQLGEQVQAKWGSSWYPAKITNIDGDGKYSIHFTRYADSDTTFDESVTLERLKPVTEKNRV